MKSAAIIFFCLVLSRSIYAQDSTSLTIRAKAVDAKFIGSSIGGAKVLIKDAVTGALLAEGETAGSTGDTRLIMETPQGRRQKITTDETAAFVAKLAIDKPTKVAVSIIAPQHNGNAKVTASTELWVFPGKDILGDGLIVYIHGFAVDILSPQTHEIIDGTKNIEVTANIVLMCGCPVQPDGMWDSNEYTLIANLKKDGDILEEKKLEYSGKSSTFKTSFSVEENGNYDIEVIAFDDDTANTGYGIVGFIIR